MSGSREAGNGGFSSVERITEERKFIKVFSGRGGLKVLFSSLFYRTVVCSFLKSGFNSLSLATAFNCNFLHS